MAIFHLELPSMVNANRSDTAVMLQICRVIVLVALSGAALAVEVRRNISNGIDRANRLKELDRETLISMPSDVTVPKIDILADD